MHSSYQLQETHYADLTLSVHDRINDLHHRAGRLAPAVAESALDSGCTDRTRRDVYGPRQSKAWDMVAEAHGWNAISDDDSVVAQAERYERDGVSYRIEYQGGYALQASPFVIVADTEAPVIDADFDSEQDGFWTPDGQPVTEPQPERETALGGWGLPNGPRCTTCHRQGHTPGTWQGHWFTSEDETPAEPTPVVPDGEYGKVTLLGPAPWGGTYTSLADDPKVAEFLAEGYTVLRSWVVTWREGKPSSREADFDQAAYLAREYAKASAASLAANREAEAKRRDLDQGQHDANRLYLSGEMTKAEHEAALRAITAERDRFANSVELAARFPGMERETAQTLVDEADDAYGLADPGYLGLFFRQERDVISRAVIGETLYRVGRIDDGRDQITEVTREQREI